MNLATHLRKMGNSFGKSDHQKIVAIAEIYKKMSGELVELLLNHAEINTRI
jgi:hypothetical protein